MNLTDAIAELLYGEQTRLVDAFDRYDGDVPFRREPWRSSELGGGRVCTMEGGRVFERAGVNVSRVAGASTPPSITKALPHLAGRSFQATGISMVLHPLNPYAPSFHANFRYFEAGDDWWFGGGIDLTPMYTAPCGSGVPDIHGQTIHNGRRRVTSTSPSDTVARCAASAGSSSITSTIPHPPPSAPTDHSSRMG